MAYESSGLAPNSISRQPTILMPFEMNITLPLGTASAKAPTTGARIRRTARTSASAPARATTGAPLVLSNSIAATSNALSASELKNCADMMV